MPLMVARVLLSQCTSRWRVQAMWLAAWGVLPMARPIMALVTVWRPQAGLAAARADGRHRGCYQVQRPGCRLCLMHVGQIPLLWLLPGLPGSCTVVMVLMTRLCALPLLLAEGAAV